MHRSIALVAALFTAALGAAVAAARDAAAVELALVLLTDVSRSMDSDEFAMVKDGYRAAFADPEVAAASPSPMSSSRARGKSCWCAVGRC